MFCAQVLGDAALARDPRFGTNVRRSERQQALRELIEASFRALTLDQVVERLDAARIGNSRVNAVSSIGPLEPLATAGSRAMGRGGLTGLAPVGAEAGCAVRRLRSLDGRHSRPGSTHGRHSSQVGVWR
ncbi:MAG: CoA transferase [Betaproteobacteria bacterium]|nr:CoA transferase [Betaproteobacteria bacterium]MDE2122592.1 CoA transferase [Betaproteobacteria bacterium]MDE2187191.1 CoA transferase [Betaproteobacteria bacterium]MDE2324052.1 CoA transferase [Betaproteobacteria bacterium]